MGNAAIYYRVPNARGDGMETITIDFGTLPFSELEMIPTQMSAGSTSTTGKIYENFVRGGYDVELAVRRINIANAARATLVRQLMALQNHLMAGGICSITSDTDKAWVRSADPSGGARNITQVFFYTTNRYPWLAGGLAGGDEVVFESDSQSFMRRECHAADSAVLSTADQITLSSGMIFDWRELDTMRLRHRTTFPRLRMPLDARNEPILTSRGRRFWELRASLESVGVSHAVDD